MKDSLIGIITIAILGIVVWTAQDKVYAYNPKLIPEISQMDKVNTGIEPKNENKDIASCDLCNQDIGSNISFSETFTLCRNCLGDNEEFLWNGKLYTTKLYKGNQENLVEKEPANSTSPPNDETVDSR